MSTPIAAVAGAAKTAATEVAVTTESAVVGAAKTAPKAAEKASRGSSGFFASVDKASGEVAAARHQRQKVLENFGVPAGHSSPALKVMFIASLGIIILIPLTQPEQILNQVNRSAWLRQLASISLLFAVLLGLSNIGPGSRRVATYAGGLFMLAIALTRRNANGTLAALESFNALIRLLTPSAGSTGDTAWGVAGGDLSGRKRWGGINPSNADLFGEGGGRNRSSTGGSETLVDTDSTLGGRPIVTNNGDRKTSTQSSPTLDLGNLATTRKEPELVLPHADPKSNRVSPPYRNDGAPVIAGKSLFWDNLPGRRRGGTHAPSEAEIFAQQFTADQDKKRRKKRPTGTGSRPFYAE